MAYDTVKLRSPDMDRDFIRQVEQRCILRSGVDMSTGEMIYELHTGQLLGSWDARISVIPKYEDWTTEEGGTPRLHACEPYLLVEASVHKILLGHNVYGGPTNFLKAARHLVRLVSQLLGVDLPYADKWTVHRVDVANVYKLSKEASRQFFDTMQLVNFPRRKKKAQKYDMAVHFPGCTTTVKFYHKGSEFRVHEPARLRAFFRQMFKHIYGEDEKNFARVERKIAALQRLADQRLRVEVGINSEKFLYDFDGRHPRVEEVTDAYLNDLHDKEIERILREGKQGMDTVRTTDAVSNRLQIQYGRTAGNRLYGFWQSMCTSGSDKTADRYTKATFYRNRKLLEDVGVSWLGSDIVIVANDSLIHDFMPMRMDRRFCFAPARNRSEFNLSREQIRLAA